MRNTLKFSFFAGAAVLVTLAASAVSIPGSKPAEGRPAPDITQVLVAQQNAWNHGELAAFMAGYWNSPELTFEGADGISRGWAGVLARYERSYPDKATMGQLQFADLEIRPLGENSALVLGTWHLERPSGEIGGVFTLVFEQFPEGWKIIHDHTSVVVAKNP